MSSITAIRGNGLTAGNTVVEPLLADSVLIVRGTHEINTASENKTEVTLNIVYREGITLGNLVSVCDPTNNEAFRGKVTGISISLESGNASQTLKIERVI